MCVSLLIVLYYKSHSLTTLTPFTGMSAIELLWLASPTIGPSLLLSHSLNLSHTITGVGALELLLLASPTVGPLLLLPWLLWWSTHWACLSASQLLHSATQPNSHTPSQLTHPTNPTKHTSAAPITVHSTNTTTKHMSAAPISSHITAVAAATQSLCCALWWLCQLAGLQQHTLPSIAHTAAAHACTAVKEVLQHHNMPVMARILAAHTSCVTQQQHLLPSHLTPSAWLTVISLITLTALPLIAAVTVCASHLVASAVSLLHHPNTRTKLCLLAASVVALVSVCFALPHRASFQSHPMPNQLLSDLTAWAESTAAQVQGTPARLILPRIVYAVAGGFLLSRSLLVSFHSALGLCRSTHSALLESLKLIASHPLCTQLLPCSPSHLPLRGNVKQCSLRSTTV